jgi:hypothetical protein
MREVLNMFISTREPNYKIPEYSLTGDLLAYLMCGLQYRYHNKGELPPSKPVQLWFGEFIHAVMEDAYLEWLDDHQRQRFPWSWFPEIRDIELRINNRLRARGLLATPTVFCPFDSSFNDRRQCPDANHPHQLIASQRAEKAINTWGQHLFPLIDEAELRLKGLRDMPNYRPHISRSNYYGITGIADVISSVNLQSAPPGNLILHYIHRNSEIQNIVNSLKTLEYEIIIDYKGMRRPPQFNAGKHQSINPTWLHHEWQILTYAWLRSQQPRSRPVVAGIFFYLNELALSQTDMQELQTDVLGKLTDIMPQGLDSQAILDWRSSNQLPQLSTTFKEQRSVRIIPVTEARVQSSLHEFDNVITQIESCVLTEMQGNRIGFSWHPNPVERNCTACDFKTFCPNPAKPYPPTVP